MQLFAVTYNSSSNYSYWNPAAITNSSDVAAPATAYAQPSISLTATATNNATINSNPAPQTFSNISGTVIAPYIYLAAPQEGSASESNTGITWGSGGTVSTRFVVGKDSSGNTCTTGQEIESDTLTGLTWVKAPTSTVYNWANANAKHAAIPENVCGYSDWRLPTVNELSSLVNYAATQNNSSPAAWLNANGFSNVRTDNYWSSTAYDGSRAWFVNFYDGRTPYTYTSSNLCVWAVRGGQ